MIKIARTLSLLLLSLVLLNLSGPAGTSVSARQAHQAQISPWVLDATRAGANTDLMIVMAEQADLSPAYDLPTPTARGRFVYRRLFETAQTSQAPLRAWLDAQGVAYQPFYVVNLIHVQDGDRALVETLAARPDVVRIEANPLVRPDLLPATPTLLRASLESPAGVEWNVAQINADDVWALGYTGQGVVVGGQDTGYQWDHPALIDAYRGWQGTAATHDYNWYDAVDGSPQPIDPYGHGTHTMGTILGDDGGGNQIGVAPGAQWIGCRDMDSSGYGSPARYLACFEFFLAPYPLDGEPEQGNPDLAPDVTNNSWYCPPSEGCSWDTLLAAVEAQRAAGILTVVSAGNSGPSCSTVTHPPGLYDAAYTVGATNSSDGIASFSSRGPVTRDGSQRLKPDVSAPGVNVRSCVPGGGYGLKSGTSMAAPHVAAGVALLWSARPDLRPHLDLTESILNTTALPRYSTQCGDFPGVVPNNVYGWGRLDVLAAVEQALSGLGHLVGRVSDSQGLPLVGVQVGATFPPTYSLSTYSGDDGRYDLPPFAGTYTVTTFAPGYNPYLARGVTVTAQATTSLNITLCQSVAGASLTYTPTEPRVGQPLTFSAAVITGTPPISYLWELGDGAPEMSGESVSHTYQVAGRYTVILTASNCFPGGPYGEGAAAWITATLPLTIASQETCTPVASVDLSLVSPGTLRLGDEGLFSADLLPDDAHKPYSYTLQVQGGSAGLPQLGHQDPLTFVYTFDATGVYTVGVWVENCSLDPVSDTLQVEVFVAPNTYWVYLPLIIRQE